MKNLLLALAVLSLFGSAPDRLAAQVQEEIEIPYAKHDVYLYPKGAGTFGGNP